jgi:hypothetical protein
MTPELIQKLAEGEREFVYECGNGWKLRCRIPSQGQVRRVAMAEDAQSSVGMLAAGERLAIEAVVSWENVTVADIGLRGLAGVDEKAPAPCTPSIVRALLEEHLEILDAYREVLTEKINARRRALEADEKNSVSA